MMCPLPMLPKASSRYRLSNVSFSCIHKVPHRRWLLGSGGVQWPWRHSRPRSKTVKLGQFPTGATVIQASGAILVWTVLEQRLSVWLNSYFCVPIGQKIERFSSPSAIPEWIIFFSPSESKRKTIDTVLSPVELERILLCGFKFITAHSFRHFFPHYNKIDR